MNRFHLFTFAALAIPFVAPLSAKADTIINLNATVPNGPAISGGGTPNNLASSFYDTLNLAAGTYTVGVVGTSTAGAVYNGWSQGYGSNGLAAPGSWQERTGFSIGGGSFSNATGNNVYTTGSADQLLFKNGTGNCGVAGNCYNSDTAALAAFSASPYTFTLASNSAVTFYIPDTSYPSWPGFADNTGGVSLDLKAVAPEPSSLLLMATGALTTAGLIRRRLNAKEAKIAGAQLA